MADEDPLYNNCIQPHSLCMRPNLCDYCGAEETKPYLIEYLYGIQTCNNHYKFAERDCKAELARSKTVLYKDALLFPECVKVFDALDSLPGGFKIKRTSGLVEPNWHLRSEDTIFDPSFLFGVDGEWTIPVCNKEDSNTIKKSVKLSWFLTPEIVCDLPADFPSMCTAAINTLNNIYKAELDSYNANIIHSKPSEVAEQPGIGMARMPDGQIVRVLNAPI